MCLTWLAHVVSQNCADLDWLKRTNIIMITMVASATMVAKLPADLDREKCDASSSSYFFRFGQTNLASSSCAPAVSAALQPDILAGKLAYFR